MAMSARLFAQSYVGRYAEFHRLIERRMEAAALIATDASARAGVREIRSQMQAAGLGRLGNAIGATSDMEMRRGVHRRADGWSASGVVFVRSRSERTRGAIEAYTQGATITPRRGRWLWVPTDDIQRLVGSKRDRKRLTPALWSSSGLDTKIGPLVPAKGAGGQPLLIVRDVGLSLAGKRGSARSLTKSGRPRKGQTARAFVVAFYAIPSTSRAARVSLRQIMRAEQQRLGDRFYAAMRSI